MVRSSSSTAALSRLSDQRDSSTLGRAGLAWTDACHGPIVPTSALRARRGIDIQKLVRLREILFEGGTGVGGLIVGNVTGQHSKTVGFLRRGAAAGSEHSKARIPQGFGCGETDAGGCADRRRGGGKRTPALSGSTAMLISNLCSQTSIDCWRRFPPSRLPIFPESGRAEAGDGDLLEQVRAGHDG